MTGYIHIYEGDGKGKTTAAVGLSVRCAGHDKRVLFTQFLKDGSSGELRILKSIDQIEVFSAEKKFGFTFQMNDAQKKEAADYYREYFSKIKEKIKKDHYDLLVLDEIIDACNAKMVAEEELLSFLLNKPEELEVVLTGRNPSEQLGAVGAYYTKIVKIRHPFDIGVASRDGIEK